MRVWVRVRLQQRQNILESKGTLRREGSSCHTAGSSASCSIGSSPSSSTDACCRSSDSVGNVEMLQATNPSDIRSTSSRCVANRRPCYGAPRGGASAAVRTYVCAAGHLISKPSRSIVGSHCSRPSILFPGPWNEQQNYAAQDELAIAHRSFVRESLIAKSENTKN